MIRALGIVLGLALGLVVAAALAGRMAHLRMAEFVPLPGWAAGLADTSSLGAGRWEGGLGGWPVTALAWDRARVSRAGLDYRVTVETPGGSLASGVALPPWPDRVTMTTGDATLDIAALVAAAPATGLAGLLEVAALRTVLALPDRALMEVEGTGQIRGLRFYGADFDTVPVAISGDAAGWRAELSLAQPLSGTLTVTGDWSGSVIDATGALTETAPIPSALRDALAAIAGQDGNDWALSARVDAPFAGRR